MTTKDRLHKAYEVLRNKGVIHTQRDLAQLVGTSAPNISSALKGDKRFLTDGFLFRFNKSVGYIFNNNWLLTGEGEMLATPELSTTNIASNNTYGDNASGNNNITISTSNEKEQKESFNFALRPVVTKQLASMPNTDVYEVVQQDGMKLEKLVAFPQYANFDFYYQVRQDAMQPLYDKGDVLALVHIPDGANIIQGAAMVVDTKSFGFLFRRIYDRGDYYECKRLNEKSDFENQNIPKDDVIRLYRVVYSVKLGD